MTPTNLKISARTRLLVDIVLPCGCSLIYDFEWVAEPSDDGSVERALELVKSKYAAPQRVPAPGGGYWESLSWVPGEVDNMCGKMEENCDLADRTGSLGRLAEVKRAMYLQALAYIETKDPVK